MLRTKIAVLVGMSCFATAAVHAQVTTTGNIRGRVTDKDTGAPVGGVTVVASGPQGDSGALTSDDGIYEVSNLPVGTYTMRFFVPGSNASLEEPNVAVSVDKTVRVNVRVPSKAGSTETYTITERAPAIDIASTRISTTIDQDFTRNVPTGRTFGEMLDKTAGAFNDQAGLSLAGSSGLENNYVVDGVNVTGIGYGGLGYAGHGSNLVNDFVRETEIITGGYNAEYGRALGGIVNVVTKSGSNEFHGSVFAFDSPYWLTGSKKVPYSRATGLAGVLRPDYSTNLGFEVGGPIIKNKLFFWAGYSPTITRNHLVRIMNRFTDANLDGQPDSNADGSVHLDEIFRERMADQTNIHQFSAKVNYVPVDNHTLQLAYNGNIDRNQGPLVPNSQIIAAAPNGDQTASASKNKYDTQDISAHWVSKLFDKKWQLEVTGSLHNEHTSYEPLYAAGANGNRVIYTNDPSLRDFDSRPEVLAQCNDPSQVDPTDPTGVRHLYNNCAVNGYGAGGYGFISDVHANRYAGQLKSTHLFRGAGHHHLKYGLDYELNRYDASRSLSGPIGSRGLTFMYPAYAQTWTYGTFGRNHHGSEVDSGMIPENGIFDPTMPYYRDVIQPNTESVNTGAFLQDSYSILPNLTLDVGLRYESSHIGEVGQPALISIDDMFAPRVGLIFDPTNEGRSKLYAHWGRFYESIPQDLISRGAGIEGDFFQGNKPGKNGCAPAGDWGSGDPAKGFRSCLPTGKLFVAPFAGEPAIIQPNLKGQYTDEIVLGGQYEVLADLTVGVSYMNRRLGRVIEDTAAAGSDYFIANPGDVPQSTVDSAARKAADADMAAKADPLDADKATAADRAKLFSDAVKDAHGFDKAKRDYNAVTLSANKRFGHSWMVDASYTYARLIGNYAGLFSADNGQADPNGTSQYDLHSLLINRLGPLPNDRPNIFRVNGYYQARIGKSGGLSTGLGFVARSGTPVNYQGADPLYGARESFLLPRGLGGRSPTITQLDLHLGWQQRLPGKRTLDVFVDVFNVTNRRTGGRLDSEYTFDASYGIANGKVTDLPHLKTVAGTSVNPNPNFKHPLEYQDPIAGRLGLRLSF